ncbi:uncharacterized protein LOC118599619 [Oryzias melastigma]|uniref:uncharacterized protein LOC118599619 n=1 Tax=Oryzias melastigma TaxID=30732 RepID=UPI00168D2A90|nr:uncharacterized protein LOC118599619 [Oryzias melastigma]
MEERPNRRGSMEKYVKKKHLKLPQLKEAAGEISLDNQYIYKDDIPEYPQPQFQVSFLKHDTTAAGLKGIRQKGGFRNPYRGPLVWFSLSVRNEDIKAAEKKLMEEKYSGMSGEIGLKRFATSPVFSPKSRYGNFRFTFPLEEVLKAYSEQFCSGGQPVMRVYKTVLYKQEIVYAVLVHSPDDQNFSQCPLLAEDPNAVCFFRDGSFFWRSEAMCLTHWYGLFQNNNSLEVKSFAYHPFYVWDNVAIAFHVGKKVLKFDVDQLGRKVKYCELDDLTKRQKRKWGEKILTYVEAEKLFKRLWSELPLEKEDHTRDDEAPPPQPSS